MAGRRFQGGAVSRGMQLALAVTLVLTVSSFIVRNWRERASAPAVEAPVEVVSRPAAESAAKPAPAVQAPSQPAPGGAAAPIGVRPPVPAVTRDAMTGRKEVVSAAPAAENAPPEARQPLPPPAPAKLPPPSFRLLGLYADKGRTVVFFDHNNSVIAARPGTALPEGFVLKSIRKGRVTVLRQSNNEQIDMNLETPK